MKIQCDCGEWFEDSFIAEWGGVCSTCKAEADLKANNDDVCEVLCSDVLSAVQSAVNRQLCDARDYYDGMQRSLDRHKNKSYDKSSLMLTRQEAETNLNNAHADVELLVKAQTFVKDKLPGLIEGR